MGGAPNSAPRGRERDPVNERCLTVQVRYGVTGHRSYIYGHDRSQTTEQQRIVRRYNLHRKSSYLNRRGVASSTSWFSRIPSPALGVAVHGPASGVRGAVGPVPVVSFYRYRYRYRGFTGSHFARVCVGVCARSRLKNVDRRPTDNSYDEVPRPRSRKLQGTVHARPLPKPLLYQLALDSCIWPRLGVYSPWACLHNKCCCVLKISACKPWLWYLQIGRRSKRFLSSLDSHVQRIVPPGYRCMHHLELPRCASSLPLWPRRLCIHGLSVELRRSLSRLYNMAIVPTVAARFGTLASSAVARKVATGSSGGRRNDSVKLTQDALRWRLQRGVPPSRFRGHGRRDAENCQVARWQSHSSQCNRPGHRGGSRRSQCDRPSTVPVRAEE